MDHLFNDSNGLKLTNHQVVKEIIDFMKLDEKRHYKIVIGSDSLRTAEQNADFVTAIVIHRVGNGGRYFWRRINDKNKFHTLRDRIWQEVLFSLDVAKELLENLAKFPDKKPTSNWDFEIHIDVGENGETKTMIQELVGMIRANNFNAKTKPESYAASKVADRHV